MRTKHFVKDKEGSWHVAVSDWVEAEDKPEGALRCTYCGAQLLPENIEQTWEAPSEEDWCKLDKQHPYVGTSLKNCVFYGAGDMWFWVGRPPLGEPVVVANLNHVTVVPNDRFQRLLQFTNDTIDRLVDIWHDLEGEAKVPLHEFLGMTEEEYKMYLEKSLVPGNIADLSKAELAKEVGAEAGHDEED